MSTNNLLPFQNDIVKNSVMRTPLVQHTVTQINSFLTRYTKVPEKSLLTNEEFVLTFTAVVMTLYLYYVLFGKRHRRKRKRLAEELRLAQMQVRVLGRQRCPRLKPSSPLLLFDKEVVIFNPPRNSFYCNSDRSTPSKKNSSPPNEKTSSPPPAPIAPSPAAAAAPPEKSAFSWTGPSTSCTTAT